MSLIAGLRLLVASIHFAIIFHGPFTSLRFSKKANRLVSGSDDGMIAIWRTKDLVCVSFKPAHKGSVTDLDVNPSGQVKISCGRDNNVRLWDMTSSKELYSRSARKSSTHARQRAAATTGFAVAVRHLEGPKDPDGLNLDIHIFVYVYKVHMCIYMLRGGMKSWTKLLFFFNMFLLPKNKSQRCERKPPIISNLNS